MTKSDLIEYMASGQNQLSDGDMELAVRAMLQLMRDSLASSDRCDSGPGFLRPGSEPDGGGRNSLPPERVAHDAGRA